MKRLTGENEDSDEDPGEEDDEEEPARKIMKFDFGAKVDAVVNKKVIDRASDLVYHEQTVSSYL